MDKRHLAKKNAARFKMNFNFSDEEDEEIDDKKDINKVEFESIIMKEDATILAGSTVAHSLELSSVCRDIGCPNAESTCLDSFEIPLDRLSLENNKKHTYKFSTADGSRTVLNNLKTTEGLKESKSDGENNEYNSGQEFNRQLKLNDVANETFDPEQSVDPVSDTVNNGVTLVHERIFQVRKKTNENSQLSANKITKIHQPSTQMHSGKEKSHTAPISSTRDKIRVRHVPTIQEGKRCHKTQFTRHEILLQNESASLNSLAQSQPSSGKQEGCLKPSITEIQEEGRTKMVNLSTPSFKQVPNLGSKLITSLFQSCSSQDSPAEILAANSDEENQRTSYSASREKSFDHISASDTDSECHETFPLKSKIEDPSHRDSSVSDTDPSREMPFDHISASDTDSECSETFLVKSEADDPSRDSFYKPAIDPIKNGDLEKNPNACNTKYDLHESYLSSEELESPSFDASKKFSSEKRGIEINARLPGVITVPSSRKLALDRERESDSSDDDNFENFVTQVKKELQPISEKENSWRKEIKPMEDFIVDDDYESEGSESSDIQTDSSDDEDEELFYIKVDNKEKSNALTSCTKNGLFTNEFDLRRHEKRISHSEDSESSCENFSDSSLSSKGSKIKVKTSSKQEADNLSNSIRNLNLCDTSTNKPFDSQGLLAKRLAESQFDKEPFLNKKSVSSFMSDSSEHRPSYREKFTLPKHLGFPARHCSDTTIPVETGRNDFKTPDKRVKGSNHLMTAPRPWKSKSSNEDKTFFLKSLSTDWAEWKRHPEAQRFVKGFTQLKDELTSKLFKIFNETVYGNKLPETIALEWSSRYTKTAGTFSYRSKDSFAKITLSQKVCDSAERVRDTLAHELCHAAVKLINGVHESHGRFWRSWASKINGAFPFMPIVARCHDYTINTKFTYQCVNCKYRVGRHSKSLDTDKKVCGHCHSRFELFLTKDLNSTQESVAYTPKAPNKFAAYVKDHYSERKKKNLGIKHGDVMRLLSKEFAEKTKLYEND